MADLEGGMAAFSAMVKARIGEGATADEALAYGRELATRFADNEVTRAADETAERLVQESGDFIGWEGVVSPGACAGCQANAGLHSFDAVMYRHPSCNCTKEYVAEGATRPREIAEDDVVSYGREQWAGWADSLTGSERHALIQYQGSDFGRINRYLRGKATDLSDELRTTFDRIISEVDSALAKGVMPDDLVLWRGTTESTLADLGKSFTSTTLRQSEALDFVDGAGASGILVRIIAPKGTPGGFLASILPYGSGEVLLPRGLQFIVRARRQVIVNGRSVTQVDVIVGR